jgi:hypothetical protein
MLIKASFKERMDFQKAAPSGVKALLELDAWNAAAIQSMAFCHSVHQSLAPLIMR